MRVLTCGVEDRVNGREREGCVSMPVVSGIQLTDRELAEFKELFNLVDKDGSGAIDAEEIRTLMNMLGMTPTPAEVIDLVHEIDTDGNGEVDFEEFLVVLAGGKNKGSYDKKSLLLAFRNFAEKTLPTGFISPEVLEAALVNYLREGITQEAAISLVAQLDKDEHGNINYLDAVNTLCN